MTADSLKIFDKAISNHFDEHQARCLVEIVHEIQTDARDKKDNFEKKLFEKLDKMESTINEMKGDIQEIKTSSQYLTKMLFGFAAIVGFGFTLMVYFIKG